MISVAFSPDGQAIAAGGCDNTASVWETASGERKHVLRGHDGREGSRHPHTLRPLHAVSSVSFSIDGSAIVTGSWDGTCKVWDAKSGSLRRTLVMGAEVVCVAFGRDFVRDERCVAFAMGLDDRLGVGSIVLLLAIEPALIRLILDP
ncbi:WD40-repeat-containing domain protein [Baffinella frigidus]|nr:WD40-repeat-containing domain protein [Cryptophyta sp. CCMP2293]